MEGHTGDDCERESAGLDGDLEHPPTPAVTECTVVLPDDLAADLEDFCRAQYVHREEAIRSLLDDWLDRRPDETA